MSIFYMHKVESFSSLRWSTFPFALTTHFHLFCSNLYNTCELTQRLTTYDNKYDEIWIWNSKEVWKRKIWLFKRKIRSAEQNCFHHMMLKLVLFSFLSVQCFRVSGCFYFWPSKLIRKYRKILTSQKWVSRLLWLKN